MSSEFDDVMAEVDQPFNPEEIVLPEGAEHYTPKEVAMLFRVDPKTLTRWEKNGLFAKYGISVSRTPGKQRRFLKVEIDRAYNELNGPGKEDVS